MLVLYVLLASALFGTTGTARALGLDGVPVVDVGAARVAVGGIVLGLFALASGVRNRGVALPTARSVRAPGALLIVGAGAAGVVAYQPAFFAGTAANGVAIGTLVALGSAPTLTGLAAWLLFRRRPERRWAVATAGAVVGVLLLSGALTGGACAVQATGVLASLAAGASYAAYTLAAKALLDRGWAPLTAIGAIFGAAGVIGVLQLLAGESAWLQRPEALAAVLWLGLATTTLAYLLFVRGLAGLPAATVATLTLAEPLVATLLGVLVLGERMDVAALVGVAVLALSLTLLAWPRRAPTPGWPRPIDAVDARGPEPSA